MRIHVFMFTTVNVLDLASHFLHQERIIRERCGVGSGGEELEGWCTKYLKKVESLSV